MRENNICEIKVSYANNSKEKIKVTSSSVAYKLLLACWNKRIIQLQEEFKILLLNRSNQVLGVYPLSKGGVAGTVVDPKLVFSVALKCNASGIILAHNHPSGNLMPSDSDKVLTKKLKCAGDFLDIKILDHLVLTQEAYFSFADEGVL
jgi:DNA repair protein RadC